MAIPANVEEYLAGVPEPQRAVLERLRAQIHAAAPGATEAISYRMPGFKVDGRFVVWFAGFADHCSLFPATAGVQEALGDQLGLYLSGKGTLRFTVEEPIPAALVRKIVRARIAENRAAADAAKRPRTKPAG